MTNTPNMNLIEPTIGVDSGLVWEQSVNANSGVIDIHNHTPGYGVPINPAGLDINSDLSFNDFSAIVLKTTSFFNQSTVLSASTYPIALYAVGGDLYYNDNSNHQIKITSAGTVNATSSGIINGTNTASFVSNVLVVNEAANTPANIQAGSVLFGNNTAGSNFVTVSAPSALASNYTLTLPTLPTQQSFMTLDQFGNETAPWTVDGLTIVVASNIIKVPTGAITSTQIANNAVGTAQIANGAVTAPKLAALNYQISGESGTFTYSGPGSVAVTNLSITLTTSGRPVRLFLQPVAASINTANLQVAAGAGATFQLFRGATDIFEIVFGNPGSTSKPQAQPLDVIDTPTAGTYTYQVKLNNGGGVQVNHFTLVGYEL